MAHDEHLVQTYADLLTQDADQALIHVIDELDATSSGYRSLQPPSLLLDAAIARIVAPNLMVGIPSGVASDVRHTHQEQRGRRQQFLEMAAASMIFVIVAALLVAVFNRPDSRVDIGRPDQGSTSVSPQAMVLQPRDGALLTIEEAKQQVQTFLNEADVALDGRLVNPREEDGNLVSHYPDIALYLLSREVAGSNIPDTFVVDADTGDILQVAMHGGARGAGEPVSAEDALVAARDFAVAHFGGFAQLALVENWLAQPDTSYLSDLGEFDASFRSSDFEASGRPGTLLFHWRLRSDNPDGWLSTFVSVGVDQGTGQVVFYAGRHANDGTLSRPTITREEAIQIAIGHTRVVYPNLTDIASGQVELVTRFRDAWQDRWVWAVEISTNDSSVSGAGSGERPRYWGIDAVTGEVVTGAIMVTATPSGEVAPSPTEQHDDVGPRSDTRAAKA